MILRRGVGDANPCVLVNGQWSASSPSWCGPQQLLSDIYGWFQFGSVPNPQVASPAAPQTQVQMTQPGAFTPDDSAAGATPQQSATLTQQAISDAELAGTYLPQTAAGGSAIWVYLIFGGVGLILLGQAMGGRHR